MMNYDDTLVYYNNPIADEIRREDMAKYGTCNPDMIEIIENYAAKRVNEESEALAATICDEMLRERIPEIREEIAREEREKTKIIAAQRIAELSPMISETVDIGGYVLGPEHFFPQKQKIDTVLDDYQIVVDTRSGSYFLMSKSGKRQFISDVTVECNLIVGASAPGVCKCIAVFTSGRTDPLVFPGGILSNTLIIKQLRMDNISTTKEKYAAEAFRRSVMRCKKTYFLTPTKHAGWNILPNGKPIFISSEAHIPRFAAIFDKCKSLKDHTNDIELQATNRKLREIKEDFKNHAGGSFVLNFSAAIRMVSRFRPQLMDVGLTPDLFGVVDIDGEAVTQTAAALLSNRKIDSYEIANTFDLPRILKEDQRLHIDCTWLSRLRGSTDTPYSATKTLQLAETTLGADSVACRTMPVFFVDRPSVIPYATPCFFLTWNEDLKCKDLETLRRILGEVEYIFIRFAQNNPDAFKELLSKLLDKINTMLKGSQIPDTLKSILVMAALLKVYEVFREEELEMLVQWATGSAMVSPSSSESISREVGAVLSRMIVSGEISISRQFGPPYWDETKIFVNSDGALNMSKSLFDQRICSCLRTKESPDNIFDALAEEGYANRGSGERKCSLKVKRSDGTNVSRKVYSLSGCLLNCEAALASEKQLISDTFWELSETPADFRPYIINTNFGLVAGSVIKSNKIGTPFTAVTGSPGTGKTYWLMMQMLQAAKSGDIVIVLDPTNAFSYGELIAHGIPENLINENIRFWDMSVKGFPTDLLDFSGCSENEQKVAKVASWLISGTHANGPNQKHLIYGRLADWIEKGTEIRLDAIPDLFADKEGRSVHEKIKALYSTVKINGVTPSTWDELLSEPGKILIISCGNANAVVGANPLDAVLDSMYSYKTLHRDSKVTLVLDEFQTLNLQRGCTLETVFSLGRKLNIAGIIASQLYSDDVRDRKGFLYGLCGTKVFFRPAGETCLKAAAHATHISAEELRCLPDFFCAIIGPLFSRHFGKNRIAEAGVIGKTYRPPYVLDYEDEDAVADTE